MIAGVIRLAPSHATPWNGSSNVSVPIATCAAVASTPSKAKLPSSRGLRLGDVSAARLAQLDGDAGQPELPALDDAGLAAPGLEVAPHDAGDRAGGGRRRSRLHRAFGNVLRRDPGEAEQRDVARPRPAARARSRGCGLPVRSLLEGCASGSAPGGSTASATTPIEALTAPMLRILLVHHPPDHARGEQRDRHRHEDDRLERHGPAHALQEHGEHEPDRRHERGHDRQPQDVVLDRRGQGVLGEQLLVVVEPDEVRALAVEEAAHDRVDRRVDDPHAEQDRGRGEERDRDAVPAPPARAPPRAAEPRPAPAVAAPPLIGLGVSPSERSRRRLLHRLRGAVHVVGVAQEVLELLPQTLPDRRAERRRLEVGEVEAERLRIADRGRGLPQQRVLVGAVGARSCSRSSSRPASPRSPPPPGVARYSTSACAAGESLNMMIVSPPPTTDGPGAVDRREVEDVEARLRLGRRGVGDHALHEVALDHLRRRRGCP